MQVSLDHHPVWPIMNRILPGNRPMFKSHPIRIVCWEHLCYLAFNQYDPLWTVSLPGNKLIFWVPSLQTLCVIQALLSQDDATVTWPPPSMTHYEQKVSHKMDLCWNPTPSDLSVENYCVIWLPTQYDPLWTVSIPGNKLIFWVPPLQTLCVINSQLSQDDASVTWPPPSMTHNEQKVSHKGSSCLNPHPPTLTHYGRPPCSGFLYLLGPLQLWDRIIFEVNFIF